MAQEPKVAREQWGSRIGVILAVAGSAVGLGNFLRFPGQAAQNGGGAFMVPYFVSLLVLGIPLCWAEWTMGRYGGIRGFNSAPGIFSAIVRRPSARYLGVLAVIVPLIIYMYYVVIEAWCLGYAWYYLTGELMAVKDAGGYGTFFDQFVGKNEDGFLYESGQGQVLWFVLITFALNFVLIYRGVSKGIETFCRWAMPLMAVLALIVLARVLTLPSNPDLPGESVMNGLAFMWEPNWDELWDPKTWLAASGQIFFSLSVGFGVVVNYASYLKRKDDVALSGLTATSMNEFFEVCLGGLITLPAAFLFFGAAAGSFGTFGLGFNALPNVFAQMWGGQFFGCAWFFMLFLAAITSSLSMLQPVIAFLEEGFGLRRHASVAFLGLITALGSGFVIYFSKDLKALDTFDFWIGTLAIVVLALVQSVLYGWVLGIDRGDSELHRGAHIRVPRFVQYVLKFVVPVYLLAILGGVAWFNVPSKDEPLFETTAVTPDVESLRGLFARNTLSLPDDARLEADGEGRWTVRDAKGVAAYTIRHGKGVEKRQDHSLEEADRPGRMTVYKHTPGYAESVADNGPAKVSVAFIVVVTVFTALLVHIAGKRWRAEGRYGRLAEIDAAETRGVVR